MCKLSLTLKTLTMVLRMFRMLQRSKKSCHYWYEYDPIESSSTTMNRSLLFVFYVLFTFLFGNSHAFGGVNLSSSTSRRSSTSGGTREQPSSWSKVATTTTSSSSSLTMTAVSSEESRRMGELTASEEKVFDLMQAIHDSKYPFRIVVIGNGAILETTSPLGPTLAVAQSPKTGKNLLTLASQDKSFEFHLQLADVAKIMLLEKETPAKTMRLIRILGGVGTSPEQEQQSMCSLILADPSEAAIQWYQELRTKYGEAITLH